MENAIGANRGFAVEPEFFPDSPNRPEFPSAVLKAGERFRAGKLTNIEQKARLIGAYIPALLQRHRADTMEILSALTGKSVAEIAAQPGMQTIREAKESLDEDLMSFFR